MLGQNKKVLVSLNKAHKTASASQEIQVKLETIKSPAEIFFAVGDYKSALSFYKRYHSLRDSILNYASVSLNSQIDKDFRKARDEKIDRWLPKKLIEKRRNFVIVLSFYHLLLLSNLQLLENVSIYAEELTNSWKLSVKESGVGMGEEKLNSFVQN